MTATAEAFGKGLNSLEIQAYREAWLRILKGVSRERFAEAIKQCIIEIPHYQGAFPTLEDVTNRIPPAGAAKRNPLPGCEHCDGDGWIPVYNEGAPKNSRDPKHYQVKKCTCWAVRPYGSFSEADWAWLDEQKKTPEYKQARAELEIALKKAGLPRNAFTKEYRGRYVPTLTELAESMAKTEHIRKAAQEQR